MKKRMVSFLLVCITAGVCASCGRADTPEQTTHSVQTTVTEATTLEETTTEETTVKVETTTVKRTMGAPVLMTPAKPFDPADRLEPTEADLERLEELLKWGSFINQDYDSKTSPILDYLWAWGGIHTGMQQYDLLRADENYMERSASEYIGSDPCGYFGEGCYKKIRADVMEYYMENVFHNTTYPSAREKFRTYYNSEETYCCYYYKDGWYYFYCPHEGMLEEYPKVQECDVQKDGHYLVTIDWFSCFDTDNPPTPQEVIQVDATLISKDGRRLWTIYSSTVQDKSKHVGF